MHDSISFQEVINVNTYDIAHVKETTNVYVILRGEISLYMTTRNIKEVNDFTKPDQKVSKLNLQKKDTVYTVKHGSSPCDRQ